MLSIRKFDVFVVFVAVFVGAFQRTELQVPDLYSATAHIKKNAHAGNKYELIFRINHRSVQTVN
jgi:hypothetical protein